MNSKGRWLIALVVVALLGVLCYLGARKFKRDRALAQSFEAPPRPLMNVPPFPQTKTRVYTQKELEEAKRTGKMPAGTSAPVVPLPANPAQSAAERTLRTVDEINRVNEMNRRLMEQQQRINQKQ